jgi:two-component system C4-dicarboxylate transport response regulator DctD
MIVEDEESIVELYTQMLSLMGHTIAAVARDGKAARATLESMEPLPDVILLDHRMPVLTGLELLAAMPARAAHVPVVFATADESARGQAKERGAFAVLVKPFAMDRLLGEIERAIAAPARGPGGGASASA